MSNVAENWLLPSFKLHRCLYKQPFNKLKQFYIFIKHDLDPNHPKCNPKVCLDLRYLFFKIPYKNSICSRGILRNLFGNVCNSDLDIDPTSPIATAEG